MINNATQLQQQNKLRQVVHWRLKQRSWKLKCGQREPCRTLNHGKFHALRTKHISPHMVFVPGGRPSRISCVPYLSGPLTWHICYVYTSFKCPVSPIERLLTRVGPMLQDTQIGFLTGCEPVCKGIRILSLGSRRTQTPPHSGLQSILLRYRLWNPKVPKVDLFLDPPRGVALLQASY